MWRSLLFTALALSSDAQIGPKIDGVCIHQLPEAGPNPNNSPLGKHFLQSTDLPQFSLMGDTEKEFSQAQTLTVCHDRERIHGLQLTVKMHRFVYFDEEKLIKRYGLEDYYAHVDLMVQNASERRMSLIGTTSQNCERTDIFNYGQVKDIWVYSDDTGIRAMTMKLSNGNQYDYGSDDLEVLSMEKFSFENGKQLMGLHGKVGYEPGNVNGDTLLTLGFFKDECSDSMQLYMSKTLQKDYMEGHMEPDKRQKLKSMNGRRGRGKGGAGDSVSITLIALIVLMITISLTTFICWRQRCKKQQQAGNASGPSIAVNDIDETPQKAPKGGDFLSIQADSVRQNSQLDDSSRFSSVGLGGVKQDDSDRDRL